MTGSSVQRYFVFGGVMCCMAAGFAGVYDDAKFVMDVRGDLDGNGEVTWEEIGNAVTYRGDSSKVSCCTPVFSADAREDPSIMQTLGTEIANPYWCEDRRPQNYIYLPQTSWVDEGTGTAKCDSAMLKFTGEASLSDVVTVYTRFRWDGPVAASEQGDYQVIVRNAEIWPSAQLSCGWTVGIRSRSTDGAATDGYLAISVNGSMSGSNGLTIDRGKWYDAFLVIRGVDESSTRVTISLIAPRSENAGKYAPPAIWTESLTVAKQLVFDPSSRDLFIGSYNARTAGASVVSRNGETSGRLFRGGIARVSIWERELSKIDMCEVAGGIPGAMWSLGMSNNSADEFGADDYSDVVGRGAEPVKDVFRPADDPIRLMRGKLTSAHPALRLRGRLAASDAGLAKAVVIDPILTDVGGSCPVKVSVNGNEVGEIDLCKETSLIVNKAFWQCDEDGEVELKIERTGVVVGSVEIDSLLVGCAFQVGIDDKKTSEMTSEAYAPQEFFAGDTNALMHARRAAVVGPNAVDTNLYYYIDIPARIAEFCDFTYKTRILLNSSHPEWGDYDFSLLLNGRTIWQNTGVMSESPLSVVIPAGSFCAGRNEIRWVLQTPSGGSFWWINYDFHRLQILRDRKTAKGFMAIVR